MKCEWCEEPGSYRVSAPGYKRFACSNLKHRAKTDRLVVLDLGTHGRRNTMWNPTGFSLSGRVCGP